MTNTGHTQRGTRKEAKKPRRRLSAWEASGLLSSRSTTQFPLTPREIEVLGLLAEGTSTREIAKNLFISVTTARNHIQNLPSTAG